MSTLNDYLHGHTNGEVSDEGLINAMVGEVNATPDTEGEGYIRLFASDENLPTEKEAASKHAEYLQELMSEVCRRTGKRVELVLQKNEAPAPKTETSSSGRYKGKLATLAVGSLMTLSFFGSQSCKKGDTNITNTTIDSTIIINGNNGNGTHHVDTLYIIGQDTAIIRNGDTTWTLTPAKYCFYGTAALDSDYSHDQAAMNIMAGANKIAVEPYYYRNSLMPNMAFHVHFGSLDLNNDYENALQASIETIEAATHNAYKRDSSGNIIMVNGRRALNIDNPDVYAADRLFLSNAAIQAPKGAFIDDVNNYVTTFPAEKSKVISMIADIHTNAPGRELEYVDAGFDKDVLNGIFKTTPKITCRWYNPTTHNPSNGSNDFDWIGDRMVDVAKAAAQNGIKNPEIGMFTVVNQLTSQALDNLQIEFNKTGDQVKRGTNRNSIPIYNLFAVDAQGRPAYQDVNDLVLDLSRKSNIAQRGAASHNSEHTEEHEEGHLVVRPLMRREFRTVHTDGTSTLDSVHYVPEDKQLIEKSKAEHPEFFEHKTGFTAPQETDRFVPNAIAIDAANSTVLTDGAVREALKPEQKHIVM